MEDLVKHAATAGVFSALGVALFAIALWIMAKIAPFSLKKELEEDQNVAVAIVMGSVFLGLAIIVAASVSG